MYDAIVIGVSLGGMNALRELLANLKDEVSIPILIVQHLHARCDNYLANYLDKFSNRNIKEAEEKEVITANNVYLAPANYHLIVEEDRTISLTTDDPVNYCRPSIDILFDSAAETYASKLIGIILTGANNDGTNGMKNIKKNGGLLVVQDPTTAEASTMPSSVITQTKVDYILSLKEISDLLNVIAK